MKKSIIIGFIIFLIIPCCKKTPTVPDVVEALKAVINSFYADPTEIALGAETTLKWSVSNFTKLELSAPGFTTSDVTTWSGAVVSPTDTIIFTLTAINDAGRTTATCQIKVNIPVLNLPEIKEFKCTPQNVNYGATTELYWYVENAKKVEINQGIGQVPATGPQPNVIAGTYTTAPLTSLTTWTLTATNDDGSVTDSCYASLPSGAKFIFDGNISRTMTSYGRPQFEGFLKNVGTKTGWNIMITFIAFSDAAKTTIIDTALGFPASLADIAPGQRAYFDAVFFDLTSHTQIVAWDAEFSYLQRDYAGTQDYQQIQRVREAYNQVQRLKKKKIIKEK